MSTNGLVYSWRHRCASNQLDSMTLVFRIHVASTKRCPSSAPMHQMLRKNESGFQLIAGSRHNAGYMLCGGRKSSEGSADKAIRQLLNARSDCLLRFSCPITVSCTHCKRLWLSACQRPIGSIALDSTRSAGYPNSARVVHVVCAARRGTLAMCAHHA